MPIIDIVLLPVRNIELFYVLAFLAALAAMIFHNQASVAIFLFITGYFVTQIPLVNNPDMPVGVRYTTQSLVSLIVMFGYSQLSGSKAFIIAYFNELFLIAFNFACFVLNVHPWYHWAIYGIVNYISLMLLIWNMRNGRNRLYNISEAWGYVYSRIVSVYQRVSGAQE